jgi:hypothetical protein
VEQIGNPPGWCEFARFYAPLAGTSLLLTVTNPILTGALARPGDPTAALSGFGVAFAVTGVLYAPLLVVQQVAAARILQGADVRRARRFALALGAGLTAVVALLAFTPAGALLVANVVGIQGRALGEARSALQLLWPVPLLTAVRSLHQGYLVAARRTGSIAGATLLRTVVLTAVAVLLAGPGRGAWIAGVAFTAALAVETGMVMAASARRSAAASARDGRREARQGMLSFSGPLMVNVVLWWTTPLLIASVLARTVDGNVAIATFVVVEAVAWFITAPVGQLQNAAIALVDGARAHARVRAFATTLSLAVTLVIVILALPDFREAVLWSWFRLDSTLMTSALLTFPLTAGYPLLYGFRQYHQGLFARIGNTTPVARGAVLRVVTIGVCGALLLRPLGGVGARLGVMLALLGLLVEDVYLAVTSRRLGGELARAARVAPGVDPSTFAGNGEQTRGGAVLRACGSVASPPCPRCHDVAAGAGPLLVAGEKTRDHGRSSRDETRRRESVRRPCPEWRE